MEILRAALCCRPCFRPRAKSPDQVDAAVLFYMPPPHQAQPIFPILGSIGPAPVASPSPVPTSAVKPAVGPVAPSVPEEAAVTLPVAVESAPLLFPGDLDVYTSPPHPPFPSASPSISPPPSDISFLGRTEDLTSRITSTPPPRFASPSSSPRRSPPGAPRLSFAVMATSTPSEPTAVGPPRIPFATMATATPAAPTATGPHNAGTSQSWISPAASNQAKFARLQTTAMHLGLTKSPFFPKDATAYNAHNVARAEDLTELARKKMEKRMAELALKNDPSRPKTREEDKLVKEPEGLTIGLIDMSGGLAGMMVQDYEELAREVGLSSSYSRVLGERTNFWAGWEESLPEGKRVEEMAETRAYWPDQNEFKFEGEQRLRMLGSRRFPLPRSDFYSAAMIKFFIPNAASLTQAERDELCKKLAEKPDDIVWFERQVVPYKHSLDRLPSVCRIYNENLRSEMEMVQGAPATMGQGQGESSGMFSTGGSALRSADGDVFGGQARGRGREQLGGAIAGRTEGARGPNSSFGQSNVQYGANATREVRLLPGFGLNVGHAYPGQASGSNTTGNIRTPGFGTSVGNSYLGQAPGSNATGNVRTTGFGSSVGNVYGQAFGSNVAGQVRPPPGFGTTVGNPYLGQALRSNATGDLRTPGFGSSVERPYIGQAPGSNATREVRPPSGFGTTVGRPYLGQASRSNAAGNVRTPGFGTPVRNGNPAQASGFVLGPNLVEHLEGLAGTYGASGSFRMPTPVDQAAPAAPAPFNWEDGHAGGTDDKEDPPPGGWQFDEDVLRGTANSAWGELLDEIDG